MKRRIISLALMICLVLQTMCAITVSAQDSVVSAEVYQEAIDAKNVLVKIGAMDASYDIEKIATKSTFLSSALVATKVSTVVSDEQIFVDVPKGYYAFNEIATGYKAGYIKGNGNGTFSPDKMINVNEAVAIAMNMLNYGYLSGTSSYQVKVNKLNLLKDVKIEADGTLKNGACAVLLKNILLADYNMLSGTVGNAGVYNASESTNLLKILYSVIFAEGVVTAVDKIYLDGHKATNQGQMAINNVIIQDAEGLANNLLGFKVEAFILSEETGYSLLAITKQARGNEEIILNAEDLTNKSTANKIVYKNSDGKEKTIELPQDYTLIYNGRNYNGFTNNVFHILQGKVRLVSYDGSDYSLVYVYEYENKIVKNVNPSEEKIFFKDSTPAINYGDTKNVVVLDANGEPMNGEDIYKDTVVTLFKSKGSPTFYTVQAGAGELIMVPDSMDGEYIYMGEEKVRMTAALIARRNEIRLGAKTIFLLDAFGEAVDFEHVEENTMYGYLVDIEVLDDSFGEIVYGVKIYTENDEMAVYKTGEYIKVNNLRKEASLGIAYFMSGEDCVAQLIKFKATDEGIITAMWQYTDKSSLVGYAGYDEDNFTLDYVTGETFQYRSGGGGVIDTKYAISGSTLRFIIPSSGNEKEYKVTTGTAGLDPAKTSGITYKLFDASKARVPAVMLEVSSTSISDFSNYKEPVVIESVSYGLNGDNEASTLISGYLGKTKVNYYVAEDDELADSGEWCAAFNGIKASELQPGDVVQFNVSNVTGEIYSMRILFRRSNRRAYDELSNGNVPSDNDYYAYLYATSAYVKEQHESSIIAYTNRNAVAAEPTTKERNRIMPFSSSVVFYVYDSQRDRLTLTNKSEYMEGYEIFTTLYLSTVQIVVIYK